MFTTAILIIYFLISISGLYSTLTHWNKEYNIDNQQAYPLALCIIFFFLIVFTVIYLKHIITSAFMLWFIFCEAIGLLEGIPHWIKNPNKTTAKKSTISSVLSVVCYVISCIGVLYILI